MGSGRSARGTFGRECAGDLGEGDRFREPPVGEEPGSERRDLVFLYHVDEIPDALEHRTAMKAAARRATHRLELGEDCPPARISRMVLEVATNRVQGALALSTPQQIRGGRLAPEHLRDASPVEATAHQSLPGALQQCRPARPVHSQEPPDVGRPAGSTAVLDGVCKLLDHRTPLLWRVGNCGAHIEPLEGTFEANARDVRPVEQWQ